MATSKITVSIPDEQLEAIRVLVRSGKAPNTSAFIKHAVQLALEDVAGWHQMLQEALNRTGGPLTDEERAWVDSYSEPRRPQHRRRGRKAA